MRTCSADHICMLSQETCTDRLLAEAIALLRGGPGPDDVSALLRLIGHPPLPPALLSELRLYNDCLPAGQDISIEPQHRYLHFIWDALERSPLSLVVDFAIPFRREIAQRLFAGCGKRFIAECGVTFNYGQRLHVGNDVFLNRGVFLDTKGSVVVGDRVAMAEDVRVFTHKHSEAVHSRRSYASVEIGDCVTIYSGAMLMPGVVIGEAAIIAGRAVVTHDVPAGVVVAGQPATVVRERCTEGNSGAALNDFWLADRLFQTGSPRESARTAATSRSGGARAAAR